MDNLRDEKKRALNIIWNASNDYTFHPEFKFFDEGGRAEIYLNYIVGAIYKYYDYKLLKRFFNYLKTDSDHEFYEQLMWIGLENCAFQKGKKDRPVLEILRRHYAEKVIRGEVPHIERALLNEIRISHYRRVLGEKLDIDGRVLEILNELEFEEDLTTEQIVLRMNEIIKRYFKFNAGQYEVNLRQYIEKSKDNLKESLEKQEEMSEDFPSYDLMKDLVIESAETTRSVFFEQDEKLKDIKFNLQRLNSNRINTDRSYIQKYYGLSIIPEQKIIKMEKALCVGNHKKSKLHFTRGEFDDSIYYDADAVYNKKVIQKQRESNINYYYENYARNNNSIINLTNKIRNTMLVNFELSKMKSKAGRLAAGRIWRNIYINDNRVFDIDLNNDIGNITVDILLDSSASQHERQEIIASQGYIIAESLTRCQIPVKVYSFCSLRGFTIFNLYRDYEEIDKNEKIFSYRASGANRDGLAIKTAIHMMENTQSDHKILIVLSDCKPYDIEVNPGTGIIPKRTEYSGLKGVNDTAYEVKRGLMKGNTVLCVFTGEDEDVPSAKRIYGHNFVRISSLNRFADMVGVLLQNQLKNL